MVLRPLDLEKLRYDFQNAEPFPFTAIDDFLEPAFARELAASYPSFEEAGQLGRSFEAVNERRKVQITDPERFPEPARRLHETLASPAFLDDVSYITGIPHLIADEHLVGGGMHVTGPGGRLDVHVDFNYVPERALHRRLNILVYLNPEWRPEWGGNVELWDADVQRCVHSFEPVLGRCVLFATSEISYHGVRPVRCPPEIQRKSFAAYYYTREAPESWDGHNHTTLFRARPEERLRRWVLMPAERARRSVRSTLGALKRRVRNLGDDGS